VIGWGIGLPTQILTNETLESIVDTSSHWIQSRTGIEERRIVSNEESTYSLGLTAAKQALCQAGMLASDVEMIVVATSTGDYGFPAVANQIQYGIGADHAAAFDINTACTGFVSALSVADSLIRSGQHNNVLVVGAETMSRIVDWTDRSTCVLFGDGAGALLLQRSDKRGGILSSVQWSDGAGAPYLYVKNNSAVDPNGDTHIDRDNFIKMDGREVFKFAVRAMTEATIKTATLADISIPEIDVVVPHQANIRIIEAAARALAMPMDRFITNVDRYGNTSAASIPIALYEAIEDGRIQSGMKIILVAFGAGLSAGGIAIEWA